MAFTLHPLTPSNIPACVSIYFTSFQNPHSLACWPRTPSIRKWWEDMIRDELDEPGAHWMKAVSTSSSSSEGEIAGFVKWVEPKYDGKEVDTALPAWPADADARLCDETFGEWARQHRELMGSRGHWYLEIVAVSPAFQGQGIGSQMLRWGTERADAAGVQAFLEASPDAVKLYERHGFREAGRTDTWIENERVRQGTWYRNVFMVREPQQSEKS